MRISLNLDEELLQEAQLLSGISGKSAVVDAALRALIEREASRRLAALGGSAPDLDVPPRNRDPDG